MAIVAPMSPIRQVNWSFALVLALPAPSSATPWPAGQVAAPVLPVPPLLPGRSAGRIHILLAAGRRIQTTGSTAVSAGSP